MLILNSTEVRKSLPMAETIAAMKSAYLALSTGKAEMPLRARLPVPPQEAVSLFMPAFVNNEEDHALAVKIVSVFPKNPEKGLPLIHASVVVMDAETGKTLALLEGGALTAIRTGAGAGAATDILARKDSKVIAIFGAGVQARTQLEAACTVRNIEKVWVYDPIEENANNFAKEMAGIGPIPINILVADTPKQAVENADIISTATTSLSPVFDAAHLKTGGHINGVGSYTPEMQEIPADAVKSAKVVVDSRSDSLAETGDLIQAIKMGVITKDHIHAEIGEILAGDKSGRENETEITYFKSVGVAVQDAMAGQLALENAKKLGLGQKIDF
ncbi:MAG: ornithine cyclodeaminase family protein [Chloroflexi bacterium]|jgi:ornithine cyclodeaminase/alanine dehydrogenase-like protein (mu-crystallin family)|nr:ornithine cyclodeaminase family protein [Chloroflexota bacterium]MBT3670688.1 ornithine cyclodeaminase family protein [Chloroflexota bacterium]MBT4002653.1 ornithine cyclodeaminase family protein [Chloroflexota bacterium]MBT4306276.1 ornithine cyclodeaminase family protein [Chloroflexota bacterium]MBT4532843.1 ornithine cyclodeaminase family protein [Chloroflexota bacterium]